MTNKSKKILSEISAGELLDKMTILEIKLDKVKGKNSLIEINKEYEILKKAKNNNIELSEKINQLYNDLKKINLKLWEIEDKIRIHEKNKDFGNEFVQLARNVYFTNDKRSVIKSEINKISGSNIKEIKQYVNY